MIKLYNLNVFDFLKEKVDDNSIDLAVIDPPYNLKKADWDTFKNENEFFNFTFKWIDLLLPKLKETSSLYIFNTAYNSAFILQHLIKRKMIFKNWIVWNKKDGQGSTKKKYINRQETILFFTKSEQYTFNADDIREPYDSAERIKHATKKGIIKNGKRWFPNPNGKLCGDVWYFSSERHKNKINGKLVKLKHITPKPKDLIERIIKASSKENDLILDCFMDIGTTGIVSKKLNRNFIGNDFDKNYYLIAKNEIETNKTKNNLLFEL